MAAYLLLDFTILLLNLYFDQFARSQRLPQSFRRIQLLALAHPLHLTIRRTRFDRTRTQHPNSGPTSRIRNDFSLPNLCEPNRDIDAPKKERVE